MWEWYGQNRGAAAVPVRGEGSPVALTFRVAPTGSLMPTSPTEPAVAYPRHFLTDDRPTGEGTLSARFFERNPALDLPAPADHCHP